MNTPEASFLTWQQQFNSEQDCLNHLKQLKWPNGFACPRCAHDKGTELHCRQLTECDRCHKQASITSGTLFTAVIYRYLSGFGLYILLAQIKEVFQR